MEGGQGISQFQKNGMNYCFLANTLVLYINGRHVYIYTCVNFANVKSETY